MKIIYGQYGNEKFYARAEGEKVYPVKGLPYDGICEDGRVLNAKDVTLLAPCRPGKIVAVGLNYLDHIKEMNDPMPDEPVIFLKPPSAVIGPNDAIVLPKRAERVDFEAELAAVIGKKCRNVSIGRCRQRHLRLHLLKRRLRPRFAEGGRTVGQS